MNEHLDYTWEEVEKEGVEYTVELEIVAHWEPYRPAKVNADPEDCYPEEGGGVSDIEVRVIHVEGPDGQPGGNGPDGQPGGNPSYWLARFAKEVEPTDAFKDWVNQAISDEEESRAGQAEEARGDRERDLL